MTVIRTESPRKVLSDKIAMIEGGYAHCDSLGEPRLVPQSYLDGLKAELAALGAEGDQTHTVGQVENPVPLHLRPQAGSAASNQFGTFEVKYATDKQTRYIAFLLSTRNLASLANSAVFDLARLQAAVAAGKVNKRTASDAITRLLACPEATPTTEPDEKPQVTRPASNKQVALIKRLASERGWNDGQAVLAHPANVIAGVVAGTVVEGRDASAAIDFLFGCAKAATRPAVEVTREDAGVWIATDGTMYRVYYGQQSGRMLMKKAVGTDLEYVGMARLEGLRRATAEEAGAWGKTTGRCMDCERRIDDPVSVDRGIGPWCWAKYDH